MRKPFAVSFLNFLLIALMLCAGAVFGAEPALRPYAPVQYGFVQNAPEVPQWAPDRVMVQFTVEGYQLASLPDPRDKSAAPVSRTGLESLDEALDALQVVKLRAAHPGVTDQRLARDLGTDRWYIFDLAPGTDVPAAAERLAADPHVADAHPDMRAFLTAIPNDPLHGSHWGHNNTMQLRGGASHTGAYVGTVGFDANAHTAWNSAVGYGSNTVVIAILDSGVDATHPDLDQVAGYDYGDNDSNPHDDSADPGHGTACAGVAAAIANNALGVAGIAGGCRIMPLKVSNSAGSLFFSAIDNAIYHAADNGADVISMSFGAATTSIPSTNAAITYAHNLGVTLLAATGNENASTISYPAYHSKVIGVGAASPCGDRKRSSSNPAQVSAGINTDPNGTTCDGEYWWGSNYGSTLQDNGGAVDVIAPTILPTTDIQGSAGYASGNYSNHFNGTSCATPYAAGVCALIISANPGFNANQVRAQLVNTAQDIVNVESVAGWDRYAGYGMVDAAEALGAVAPPAAVAAFAADDTVGCAPLTVNFTDQSTGTISTWQWDFGDGTLRATQNPSHTYTVPGVYNVTLTISGPDGNDTRVKTGYINVGGPPVVAFSGSASFITAGQSVTFTDASGGNPTSWAWDFGDGGTSTEQHPTHVFNTPGVWHVTLTATNECGPGSLTKTNMVIVIFPPVPTAAFSVSGGAGCAPLAVDFTDESTGQISAWAWDFGDGATDTVPSPTHIYTVAGTYDVSLTVSNLGGPDTATLVGAVTVGGAPTAAFAVSDTAIAVGGSVTFTDTSAGDPVSWAWDFGDGGTSTDQNPTHQYLGAGTFAVALVATNACGADTLLATDHITVSGSVNPVAAFSLSPASGCAPLEVTFTDESLNDVASWAWDFGDGNQSTSPSPVHTYSLPGSYDVTLVVMGSGGADTLAVAGAVVVQAPVVAGFAISDTLVTIGVPVTFTGTASGNPTTWSWDFGDAATDTVAEPSHSYAASGTYDVTLIVSNGCSADTLTVTAAVRVNGATNVGDLLPARFGLEQNYPNPFNPSTTFVYSLDLPGHARLEVFDLSGRRIATLVNGEKGAGRHEVSWRPADLASGIYFSRLTVGTQSDTKRVTLLK